MERDRLRRAISFAIGLLPLEASWLVACEHWRASSPFLLALILLGPWTLFVIAWLVRLPRTWRWHAALAVALLVADGAIELASPQATGWFVLPWQALRVVCIVVASIAVHRRWKSNDEMPRKTAKAFAVARALSAATFGVLAAVMTYLAVDGSTDAHEKGDAALVLGFALADDGSARPQLVGRVDRAAALVREGATPKLVVSGGAAKAGHTEAGVMRELLLQRGVPESAIVEELRARSTIENFACARPILDGIGARKVLVVTEPWHMTRAMLLARRHGYDARPAPASSEIWRSPRHAVFWLFRDSVAYVAELARQPFAKPGVCASPLCEGCRTF
jgi:vancomycin permeability regulator SanA